MSDKPSLKAVALSYARQSLHNRKTLIILTIVVLFLIAASVLIVQHNMASSSENADTSNEQIESLEYQTILPDGKSVTELGGWKRVSPTKSDPVYAYIDKISDISVNVSEQPLPKSFIGDTDDQVAELAKRFNATTKINADDIKVYVGSSSKGPQSVIFTKNSLLILIKSQERIDDAAWVKYIKSLN
jgi:cell division protein FtsL